MKPIQKLLVLDKVEYYEKHLSIVNSVLPITMTLKEIEVLSNFLALDRIIIEEDMFNTIARKKVMDKLGLKPGGLGNHLKSLIEKGFLTKHEITKKITLREFLIPDEPIQGYQFKIRQK